MFVDEKGKLFGKINLLDLFLLIAILAIIAVAGLYFMNHTKSVETLPVTYIIEIQNKEEAFFDHIHEGEAVTDTITGVSVGVISGFNKEPAQVITPAGNELIAVSPEGRCDGYVQITVDATISVPDMLANDIPIKIGRNVSFRSETTAIQGYIVDMEYDEELLGRLQ